MSDHDSPLYECCEHCLMFRGECPDLADNGGHSLPCDECTDGAQVSRCRGEGNRFVLRADVLALLPEASE